MIELADAPRGYVWSYRDRGLAHLIPERDPFRGLRRTVCGMVIRGRGRTCSFQVGGYSAIPCGECKGGSHDA